MSYLGESVPKLGFGLMRLPQKDGAIDLDRVSAMVDEFMAAGFSYYDTAYGYHDGESEKAAKACIVDRYPRGSYQLATKLPAWAGAKDAQEARQMFYTSLERTGAGYFDFYLLHNLGGKRTKAFDDYDIWSFVAELREKGLVKHVGFSMHDSAESLDRVLTEHPEMEFVQLQINYADWEDERVQSRLCYETARKHGKPVIVMEPVRGGNLANLPESIGAPMKLADPGASYSSWALRWCAQLEGLVTILSGMSTLEQMRENIATFKAPRPMTDAERAVVAQVTENIRKAERIPCTLCKYCVKDCPQKINIPGVFDAMNIKLVYGDLNGARTHYGFAADGGGKASDCAACGACEGVCPQGIKITEELRRCAAALER